MPMLRAVPFTLLIAASMEAAFRSGSFCLAISATCFSVTLPTLSLFGEPDPLATPAARFNKIEAGGVLVIKVNDLSLNTEITTGMMRPSSSFELVLALNCLQNSMMLMPAWPSAGPTGGAGVALPAAIWSFTDPVNFFGAICFPLNLQCCLCSYLLYLPKFQFHRSRASEDRDHDLQRGAVFVDFVHRAVEVCERPLGDAYRLVLLELHLELRLFLARGHAEDDLIDFFVAQGRGVSCPAQKSGDARRSFH